MKIDFSNLEELEIRLIDLANDIQSTDDQFNRTMGRALKSLAPAWVQFIRNEMQRNEEHGPGLAVSALVKNYAFLTYLLLSESAKSPDHFLKACDGITALFNQCFNDFKDSSTVEKPHDPAWNKTVH